MHASRGASHTRTSKSSDPLASSAELRGWKRTCAARRRESRSRGTDVYARRAAAHHPGRAAVAGQRAHAHARARADELHRVVAAARAGDGAKSKATLGAGTALGSPRCAAAGHALRGGQHQAVRAVRCGDGGPRRRQQLAIGGAAAAQRVRLNKAAQARLNGARRARSRSPARRGAQLRSAQLARGKQRANATPRTVRLSHVTRAQRGVPRTAPAAAAPRRRKARTRRYGPGRARRGLHGALDTRRLVSTVSGTSFTRGMQMTGTRCAKHALQYAKQLAYIEAKRPVPCLRSSHRIRHRRRRTKRRDRLLAHARRALRGARQGRKFAAALMRGSSGAYGLCVECRLRQSTGAARSSGRLAAGVVEDEVVLLILFRVHVAADEHALRGSRVKRAQATVVGRVAGCGKRSSS